MITRVKYIYGCYPKTCRAIISTSIMLTDQIINYRSIKTNDSTFEFSRFENEITNKYPNIKFYRSENNFDAYYSMHNKSIIIGDSFQNNVFVIGHEVSHAKSSLIPIKHFTNYLPSIISIPACIISPLWVFSYLGITRFISNSVGIKEERKADYESLMECSLPEHIEAMRTLATFGDSEDLFSLYQNHNIWDFIKALPNYKNDPHPKVKDRIKMAFRCFYEKGGTDDMLIDAGFLIDGNNVTIPSNNVSILQKCKSTT